MLRRFASASAIASIAIAFGALTILLMPAPGIERLYPLTIAWCFVAPVWGLWAMVAPAAWVPERLPLWGAILGLAVGLLAAFVVNLPFRIFGVAVPGIWRAGAVVLLVVVYYFLWILVRVAYRSLGAATAAA